MDTFLVVQILVAAVLVPVLLSGLLYFFWPNVWKYFADKLHPITSVISVPCVKMYQCCCSSHDGKNKRHQHHYASPDRSSFTDPMRMSKTKSDRKLRVENPKRREMSAIEDQRFKEETEMKSKKAQATRVEKLHKMPGDSKPKSKKNTSNFKYPFREEGLSTEVNPYISSNSPIPFDNPLDKDRKLSVGDDVESGRREEH